MFKFFTKALNDKRGFTLVELIVVIAIIAILALIAVPRFGGFSDSAKKSADEATAKTIENAITMYIASGKTLTDADITDLAKGKVPDDLKELLDEDVGTPQQKGVEVWTIEIDEDDGNVSVSVGTDAESGNE